MMRTTIEVSIHAPTWGATNGGERTKEYIPVSIHAPTWGATFILFSFLFLNVFQSTLPHGERLLEVRVKHKCSVSIHAPTWGATVDILTSGTFELFQSTLPHGERLPRTCRTRSIIGFNPRSHMGSDPPSCSHPSLLPQFQSTLPHGERLYIIYKSLLQ